MAPNPHQFESVPSAAVRRRLSSTVAAKQKPNVIPAYTSLTPMWAGIAASPVNNNTQFEIAISIHDSVYNTDFTSLVLPWSPGNLEKTAKVIEEKVLEVLRKFSNEHLCKFLGAGITLSLLKEV
ncbi:hypothetical protein MPER_13887 [Moniliophthora perniciosa FA553]|nr:hypothetical protein MPER_13887 [Moniliophthora perniciosa FA553]